MYTQTYQDYVIIFDDNKQEINRYSYQELGININSRPAWDREVLSRKILKGIAELKIKTQPKQLTLF